MRGRGGRDIRFADNVDDMDTGLGVDGRGRFLGRVRTRQVGGSSGTRERWNVDLAVMGDFEVSDYIEGDHKRDASQRSRDFARRGERLLRARAGMRRGRGRVGAGNAGEAVENEQNMDEAVENEQNMDERPTPIIEEGDGQNDVDGQNIRTQPGISVSIIYK